MSKTKVSWLAPGAPLHQRQHHGKNVTEGYDDAYLTTGIAYTRMRSALLISVPLSFRMSQPRDARLRLNNNEGEGWDPLDLQLKQRIDRCSLYPEGLLCKFCLRQPFGLKTVNWD